LGHATRLQVAQALPSDALIIIPFGDWLPALVVLRLHPAVRRQRLLVRGDKLGSQSSRGRSRIHEISAVTGSVAAIHFSSVDSKSPGWRFRCTEIQKLMRLLRDTVRFLQSRTSHLMRGTLRDEFP